MSIPRAIAEVCSEISQVTDGGLLAQYEQLMSAEERSHVMAASTPELRKERLLARVLVRTTLSR